MRLANVCCMVFAIAALTSVTLRAQDPDERPRILPAFGLHLLNVDIAAVNAGLAYRPFAADYPFWTATLELEGGVAGGGALLGFGRTWPPGTDWGGPGSELSVRLQTSFLRTWGDPFHVGPRQSFVGLGVQVKLTIIGVRASILRRVAGSAPGDGSVFSAGLVLGWP